MNHISESANIAKTAQIAETAIIHDYVSIGEHVIIHDYVVVYPNTIIKDHVEIYDHSVLGKMPKSPGCLARELKKEYPGLEVNEYAMIGPHATVYAGAVIGRNSLLGDSCSVREECEIGEYSLISRNVTVNYNTKIGNHSKVLDNSHITGNMYIGNNVFVGVGVSTSNDNAIGKGGYTDDQIRGPYIEDDVAIGTGANILPNTRIGRNSVVGASALVTKDVPPNVTVMGVPARIVERPMK